MVKASLHIDDLNFNVLEFEHTISKQVDHEGYPTSKAGFRGLNLIIELSSDNTFWEYAIADNLPLPKVVLKISPAVLGQSQTRYMYLYDCHVVYQKTKFTAYSNEAAYQHVTITCQGLEMSTSKTVYQTLWRKTFPNKAVTPTVRENNAPEAEEEATDAFNLSIKHLAHKSTFVPMGIPAFNGTPENKHLEFEIEIAENDIDEFQVEFLHNDKVLQTYYSGRQTLDEVIVTAKGSGSSSNSTTTSSQNAQKNYPKGNYSIKWDGFNSNGIYDSTVFTTGQLKARLKGKRNGTEKTVESNPFAFTYKEVEWVDITINKNTKRIDVTLRVNLTDGGAIGVECSEEIVAPDPIIIKECPWDKIPESEIKPHQKIIKSRTKSFEDLEQLALDGLNYHWGRNRNHFIAKHVAINGETYEIFVNAINTPENAMDDIDLTYNTNSFWGRSNNPGCVSGFKSFLANIAQYIPYVPLNETIFYNVGYVNNVYKSEAHFLLKNSWFYIDSKSLYKKGKSKLDMEFSYTCAHEIGHTILRAYSEGGGGSADYSYKHKGSSGYSETKPINDGGFSYPTSEEIDVMKYYNNTPYFLNYDFNRIIAESKDALSLIWLTKIELK
jgi:hypothetical protein